jgi:hypothetical protein
MFVDAGESTGMPQTLNSVQIGMAQHANRVIILVFTLRF